jgi:PAS domain-containing protein
MKKKLEENEHKLRLIILQAPVSIAIVRGLEYVIDIINPRALELAGRKEEELLNKPIFLDIA